MSKKQSQNKQGVTYLSNLAQDHGVSLATYEGIMAQYDKYLGDKYNFTVGSLKSENKKAYLMPWQAELFRRLNPTDFEIETMKELGEYESWHLWMQDVRKY